MPGAAHGHARSHTVRASFVQGVPARLPHERALLSGEVALLTHLTYRRARTMVDVVKSSAI